MSNEPGGGADQPYVAHYSWPDQPPPVPKSDQGDVERQAAIEVYLGRWRTLRYAVGVVFACMSLGGGVYAVLAIAAAWSGGTSHVFLDSGGPDSITLSGPQMTAVAITMVALEVLLVSAALLLFAKRAHRHLWLVVTVAAAAATGALLAAAATDQQALLSLFSPISYCGPLILVAGICHLIRAYRFQKRWGCK